MNVNVEQLAIAKESQNITLTILVAVSILIVSVVTHFIAKYFMNSDEVQYNTSTIAIYIFLLTCIVMPISGFISVSSSLALYISEPNINIEEISKDFQATKTHIFEDGITGQDRNVFLPAIKEKYQLSGIFTEKAPDCDKDCHGDTTRKNWTTSYKQIAFTKNGKDCLGVIVPDTDINFNKDVKKLNFNENTAHKTWTFMKFYHACEK